jgi:hypothetical protein
MKNTALSFVRTGLRSARALGVAALALGLHVAMAQHAGHGAPAQAAAPKPTKERAPRPQLGTGAAFAPDGSLWLVGLDGQGRLFVQTAQSQAQGWQWGAAHTLDTGTDKISADGENRPKLLFGPKGVVLVSYTQVLDKPFTGFIRMLRSTDGGQTFGAPATVHADRQIITHRFESIAFDAQGALHTVWIDKRDLETAPRVNGKSTYRGAAIYRNVSLDGGGTFGPDIKVADHSCECCRIALAQGPDGRMRALWRHVFEPNVRDHAIAVLDVQGKSADIVRATEDGWRIDGCPHHGPALVAAQEGFHAVWFGIRQEGDVKVAGVRYARLAADGRPEPGSVQRVPDARAEHADLQAQGAKVAVVWRSTDGTTSTLKAWTSTDAGKTFRAQVLGQAEGDNDFPRLVRHGERMVVVWRNSKEVKIHDIGF